ncbi:hypothetical protein MKW98_032640 [Papaver atlanticum]|uniref:Uncharacterized protein n=1 Tax=Papaver atlanticum TaxID=357466 RepID=A0AAD4SWG8_9MAGN|nr:hypothetical protein MKW98_032640 [Papaver atlanticum]
MVRDGPISLKYGQGCWSSVSKQAAFRTNYMEQPQWWKIWTTSGVFFDPPSSENFDKDERDYVSYVIRHKNVICIISFTGIAIRRGWRYIYLWRKVLEIAVRGDLLGVMIWSLLKWSITDKST